LCFPGAYNQTERSKHVLCDNGQPCLQQQQQQQQQQTLVNNNNNNKRLQQQQQQTLINTHHINADFVFFDW
jgi:hypothetical protein